MLVALAEVDAGNVLFKFSKLLCLDAALAPVRVLILLCRVSFICFTDS